ncbi:MAG: 4Fe-4S dicluster domain-containing protein, partial [Rickettsiales bacterium]
MGRLSLMFDLERCIGCKSCEVACKQEHGLGPGEYRNRVVWLGDGAEPGLDFLTVACQHCERPACLRACPVNPKAITKHPETGVVAVNENLCTGCGECVTACPYGAMGYDSRGHHAVKCDLCADRRAEGAGPACASVCPGHAISFGERADHLARAEAEGRTVRDHDAFLLDPATVYLDRIGRPENATPLAERRQPAVSDPPDAQTAFDGGNGADFPYGLARAQRKPNRVEPGTCTLCFNCCSVKFHFDGDKLVKITGNEEDPVLKGKVCPKSQMTLQMYHNERRLDRPLKRVGARGEGKFEPISWEQAFDEIAAKIGPLRESEPEALGIFAGTRTGMITIRGFIRMFGQMWGTPNVETTDPFCAAGKNLSYALTHGANGCGNSYVEDDIGSAGMYLYIGDNQAETR